MFKKVKISILMTIFNTDFEYVKRAIDSVLNQDFQDFELIIIDDGSKDTHREVLAKYIEQNDDKIVYIRHCNWGQSAAINRGVLYSLGDFITILDGDDEYKKNHLSACLKEIKNADLMCSTTETIVNTENDYYVPDIHDLTKVVHLDDSVLFGTLFGRRKVFKSQFFKNGYGADADFYEKAKLKFTVKKADIRTYVYYRNIPNSICATLKNEILLSS
jgi:glycosyltransferase involved in cell wall biosynthesis